MHAPAIVTAAWHSPRVDALRHSRLTAAMFALATVALTALAVARFVAVLPSTVDFTAWAAEPYHWYVTNVLAFR